MKRHQLNSLTHHQFAWLLDVGTNGNRNFRTEPESVSVRQWTRIVQHRMARTFESNDYFGCRHWQPFSRANIKRDALPARIVDVKSQRGKRLDTRIRGDTRLAPVAQELAANQIGRLQGANRLEQLRPFIPACLMILADRTLHRQ